MENDIYKQNKMSKKFPKEEKIEKICEKCAKALGKALPPGHCASFWGPDICDVCKRETSIADIHDFGYNYNG